MVCGTPGWVGDGYCDVAAYTPECNYDGGDCCNIETSEISLECNVETSTVEEISSSITNMDTTTMYNTEGIALLTKYIWYIVHALNSQKLLTLLTECMQIK